MRRLLGIPYARAERFGAPELVPFDASKPYDAFGPAAPQPVDSPLGEVVPGMRVGPTDEHACLTLNVWAPVPADGLPVLVWFPGGSFVIGGTAQRVYDGSLLAEEQQVVVVTVNYRLGALGFLDARSIGGVANCGLRDALCALEWVQRHIDQLGGDPTRVVAFGESAGGGLVLHALASGRTTQLVRGAIVQSGATFATLDPDQSSVVLRAVCDAAGVDQPQALRTLPAAAIVDAQQRAHGALLSTIGMMPFHPAVDDEVLTAPPVDALAKGAAAGVALLAGTTTEEMRLFVAPSALDRARLVRRVARYRATDAGEAERIVATYERELGTDDPAAVWLTVFSDAEMQAPLHAVLDAQSSHAPTFAYLFGWAGPDVGACHGVDIPFAFGTLDVDGWDVFIGLDDDARRLSAVIRNAWAAFARDGDPGWPPVPATMVLGRTSSVAGAHPFAPRLRALATTTR